MEEKKIYRYKVHVKDIGWKSFTEEEWDIAWEYARAHGTWVKLI